jgi:hypothetical protein
MGVFALWLRRAVHEPTSETEDEVAWQAGGEEGQAGGGLSRSWEGGGEELVERKGTEEKTEGKKGKKEKTVGTVRREESVAEVAKRLPLMRALRTYPVEICLCCGMASMWCANVWLTGVCFPGAYSSCLAAEMLLTKPLCC